jgi:hypothetical protein
MKKTFWYFLEGTENNHNPPQTGYPSEGEGIVVLGNLVQQMEEV